MINPVKSFLTHGPQTRWHVSVLLCSSLGLVILVTFTKESVDAIKVSPRQIL